jgi:hypothetical protein
MDRPRNETIRTKIGKKKDTLQETEEQQSTSCEWRTAELLDGLQNATRKGKEGAADQPHMRMSLGTV